MKGQELRNLLYPPPFSIPKHKDGAAFKMTWLYQNDDDLTRPDDYVAAGDDVESAKKALRVAVKGLKAAFVPLKMDAECYIPVGMDDCATNDDDLERCCCVSCITRDTPVFHNLLEPFPNS